MLRRVKTRRKDSTSGSAYDFANVKRSGDFRARKIRQVVNLLIYLHIRGSDLLQILHQRRGFI